MKTSLRPATSLFRLVIAFSLCAGSVAFADDAPGFDQASAELQEHHRHHHGGITKFIAMSLDTLGTDDAKRTKIERVQKDLHTCMAPAGGVEKSLLSTLADGVAAGSIDPQKIDPVIAQLNISAALVQSGSVDAVNRLHGILSPAERAALVDKMQAHWAVWQDVNHKADPSARENGSRLALLAAELSLSADQIDKMSAALQVERERFTGTFDPAKGEAHLQAFAAAFAADTFDAKTVTVDTNGDIAAHGAKRMALFYETVTPLLTPAQRAKLAAHLREHAGHQQIASSK